MEYTIQKLAQLAGITTRTLRYYDQIGLLLPHRLNSSGYRIYSEREVDRLQQILFYREMGMELLTIKQTLEAESFDRLLALKEHLTSLQNRRSQIDLLIETVTKTIQKEEGNIKMTDQEKFEGLKKQLLLENEQKYGEELRTAYGEQTVKQSWQKLERLSKEEFQTMQELGTQINSLLEEAVANAEAPEGESGRSIARLHKQWLSFYWPAYSKEAHQGLVQMYLSDQRFTDYYDKNVPGCAAFLKKAVDAYLQTQPVS